MVTRPIAAQRYAHLGIGAPRFRVWALTLTMLVACTLAIAEHPEPAGFEQAIYFNHLETDDGLSQGTITAIFQDASGFLWFGTEGGLNRFDGTQIESYVAARGNNASLSNDFIWAIAEDARNQLWIATNGGGVSILDPQTRTFSSLRHAPQDTTTISSDAVRSIAVGEDGTVWIGTRDAGLNSIEAGSNEVRRWGAHTPALPIPESATVFDILVEADESIWFATSNGLYRFDPARQVSQHFSATDVAGRALSDDTVIAVATTRDGTVFAGTYEGGLNEISSSGAIRWHRSSNEPHSLPGNYVRDILEDADGRLWIATTDGLALMDRETGLFKTYLHDVRDDATIGNNHTMALLQDRSGILWVGTRSNGVSSWNPRSWGMGHARPEALSGAMITSFASTSSDQFWIGTMGRGLFLRDGLDGALKPLGDVIESPPQITNAMSLAHDPNGALWVGTLTNGVYVLENGQPGGRNYRQEQGGDGGLRANGIMSLLVHPTGRVWVGTFGGGVSIIDHEATQVQALDALSATGRTLAQSRVTALANGLAGNVWIATDGDGLFHYKASTGALEQFRSNERDANSLSSDRLYSLYFDVVAQALWIGTAGSGLDQLRLDDLAQGRRAFSNYSKNDGLADNVVYGIVPDDSGSLWLSSNNGVTRFSPGSRSTRVFHSRHGLQSDEFNFGAHHRTDDGLVLFGGSNGYNAFRPDNVVDAGVQPDVALTGIRVDSQPLPLPGRNSLTQPIELRHDQRIISLQIAALDFVDARKNTLKFRLNGFDAQWRYAASGQPITYTNLDAGMYTLEVFAINSEGSSSAQPLVVPVNVRPAPWRTGWAFLLYIGLGLLLIWSVLHWHRKRLERRAVIHRLAHHDSITGLPNRNRFIQQTQRVIESPTTPDSPLSVVVVAFNHVDRISDSYGLEAGDQTLQALANRLLHVCTETCAFADHHQLARVAGEEFAIAIQTTETTRIVKKLTRVIARQFSDARIIGGDKTSLAVALGVAHLGAHGDDAETLLRNARAAVHVARGSGSEQCLEFSPDINDRLRERLTVEQELRLAIERNELRMFLQPKFDTTHLQLVGAEALVRWQHPQRGLVPPGIFIPVAEDSGLIADIGHWISTAAARQIRQWCDHGKSPVPIAINMSGVEVTKSDPAKTLRRIAETAGIDPKWLEIELTETLIMQDATRTKRMLEAVRNLGCRISVDDFGTGYSSLAYLKRFPVDQLKIDQSFVRDIDNSDEDLSICAAIIAMAHSLNLQVIAEGVETDAQLRCLVDIGCDQVQGFLLGRPIPAEQFAKAHFRTEPAAQIGMAGQSLASSVSR